MMSGKLDGIALLALLALGVASWACQSAGSRVAESSAKPSAPAHAAAATASTTAASSSEANGSAQPAPGTREARVPACGLSQPTPITLLPVIHNHVVVQKDLGAAALSGPTKLLNEPDDFAEYYLAERSVQAASLPLRLRELRGASVRVLDGPEGCNPTLGKVSAWGWADEQGLRWKRESPAYNARLAFMEGDTFLVAAIEPECDFWGAGVVTLDVIDDVRAWKVRSLMEEHDAAREEEREQLIAQGRAAVEREPGLAVQNAAYERFREGQSEALPEHWWSLPRTYEYFSYATLDRAALLIVELSARLHSEKRSFDASWFGVWCVDDDGSLVSLGPDYIPDEFRESIRFYRHRLSLFGSPGTLPNVLYSYFALMPKDERYHYVDYTLPAVPRIDALR